MGAQPMTEGPPNRTRGRAVLALKFGVSFSLLGWILHAAGRREGFDHLAQRVEGLEWAWILAAIALQFAPALLGTWRWRVLLDAQGLRNLRWIWLFRHYLAGMFFGALTPSTAGLDVYRAYAVAKKTGEMARSASAVVVEKFVGLIGLALVCLALCTTRAGALLGGVGVAIALATAACSCFGLWLIANAVRTKPLVRLVPAFARARVEKILDAAGAPGLTLPVILSAVALGSAAHVAMSSVFALTALGLGLGLDPLVAVVTGNVIVVATLLPISLAGVGVREGVAVVLLARSGVSTTDATLVALMGYLTLQVPTIVGGVWSLLPDPYGRSAQKRDG